MESSQPQVRVINDHCDLCSGESSPTVVTTSGRCLHKFCVKCFLGLWTELREPCICPLDGVRIRWLCPARLHHPEEIGSLIKAYNPLFGRDLPTPKHLAKKEFVRKMMWLYGLEGALCVAGLIAYSIKAK